MLQNNRCEQKLTIQRYNVNILLRISLKMYIPYG